MISASRCLINSFLISFQIFPHQIRADQRTEYSCKDHQADRIAYYNSCCVYYYFHLFLPCGFCRFPLSFFSFHSGFCHFDTCFCKSLHVSVRELDHDLDVFQTFSLCHFALTFQQHLSFSNSAILSSSIATRPISAIISLAPASPSLSFDIT